MAPPVYSFGVDLSKRFLDCFLLPEQSRFRLTHDEAGITQLRDRARDLLRTGARVLVVVEASGGYERLLHEQLTAADVPVAIVNPKRVRAYAKGQGPRALAGWPRPIGSMPRCWRPGVGSLWSDRDPAADPGRRSGSRRPAGPA